MKDNKKTGSPPRWLFVIVMVGGFIASGIYIGMMRVEGISSGNLLGTMGFGALGLFMMRGALAKR